MCIRQQHCRYAPLLGQCQLHLVARQAVNLMSACQCAAKPVPTCCLTARWQYQAHCRFLPDRQVQQRVLRAGCAPDAGPESECCTVQQANSWQGCQCSSDRYRSAKPVLRPVQAACAVIMRPASQAGWATRWGAAHAIEPQALVPSLRGPPGWETRPRASRSPRRGAGAAGWQPLGRRGTAWGQALAGVCGAGAGASG